VIVFDTVAPLHYILSMLVVLLIKQSFSKGRQKSGLFYCLKFGGTSIMYQLLTSSDCFKK